MKMFQPNWENIAKCARNEKPDRIPLYEHNICDQIMERITGRKFAHLYGTDDDKYFAAYNGFFEQMGYDTVTYEACITAVLPYGGALAEPKSGYIDSRERFESYPWDDVLPRYIQCFESKFKALEKNMPRGMKAIGGVGNGVFEIAQDLVGYENLCIMSYEEPELYADLFQKVGNTMYQIWSWFMDHFADTYCVVRFGDDLGYKSNTMIAHKDIREHIVPQYKRVVDLAHRWNKPFLLHSCGYIFDVMDDMINVAGIDAKHSNEDQIADMSEWVKRYGARIGNFGGIDTDHLVRMDPAELKKLVERVYALAIGKLGGFAIGSGNSIPTYVDPERYLVMINTVRKLRGDDSVTCSTEH